jgi:putative ABC transport system permease protein
MGPLSAIRQLTRDVRAQKLRTALVVFGVVWGTVAVTLLLAFGNGLHEQIYRNAAGLGENICIVWPSRTAISFEGLPKGRRIRATPEDVEMLRREARHVGAISGEHQGEMKLHHGSRTIAADVHGVEPSFGEMRNVIPRLGGRFLNRIDEDQRRRVVFLGDELAADVFGDDDPIGDTVMLGASPFVVVGVLQPKKQDSSYSGRDEDKALIPASTYRAITGARHYSNFIAKAPHANGTEAMKRELYEILGRKHRFDPDDEEALMIWDTSENFQFIDAVMAAFRTFLGIVGALTLVVGGIGVSNVMNVVVEERTKEIGIKLALGARPRAILAQMMTETAILTAIGGAIGVGSTYLLCAALPDLGVEEFIGRPVVSLEVGALAAGLLALVALFAGWFPARDAARLDPVVAMKKEV